MKTLLKLESLGLLAFFTLIYFSVLQGKSSTFFLCFLLPDLAFLLLLFSKKATIIAYNFLHHLGALAIITGLGYFLNNPFLLELGVIFMAHACFDRALGIGLKYFDHINHTHLGWIGKKKQLSDLSQTGV